MKLRVAKSFECNSASRSQNNTEGSLVKPIFRRKAAIRFSTSVRPCVRVRLLVSHRTVRREM